MLTQPRAAVPLTQRSCCFIETQAALPKDAGWECSPGVREQWLMAKCSHHKHWSELWQGTAGEGSSVLSAAMDSKVEKVTGQKEEWSLQWMERCFPNSDMTRRGWESQQAWRGAGAHQHQVPEMTKSSLEIQKSFSMDFVQPRRPLQAAGVGARSDERISSTSTQKRGGELFPYLLY